MRVRPCRWWRARPVLRPMRGFWRPSVRRLASRGGRLVRPHRQPRPVRAQRLRCCARRLPRKRPGRPAVRHPDRSGRQCVRLGRWPARRYRGRPDLRPERWDLARCAEPSPVLPRARHCRRARRVRARGAGFWHRPALPAPGGCLRSDLRSRRPTIHVCRPRRYPVCPRTASSWPPSRVGRSEAAQKHGSQAEPNRADGVVVRRARWPRQGFGRRAPWHHPRVCGRRRRPAPRPACPRRGSSGPRCPAGVRRRRRQRPARRLCRPPARHRWGPPHGPGRRRRRCRMRPARLRPRAEGPRRGWGPRCSQVPPGILVDRHPP